MDVGSPEFRKQCVEDVKRIGYPNLGNMFEKYLTGSNFDSKELRLMGYDYWSARNIAAYLNHPHNDNYYSRSLGWE
jgi:hypothetical protein